MILSILSLLIYIYDELKVYVAIKNYMNAVKQLKELKELELLRQSEINQIENATKIKLNVLNNEIDDILEDLDDSNGIGAHNHLVCKRILNHLVNGLVVKVLGSQSRSPVFKTTGWLQG